jgi:S1-C subfamily serine protease
MKSRSFFAATAAVAIAVAAGCGGDEDKKLSQTELIEKVTPNTVRIAGKQSGGSGVVIDAKQGLVLTNAHVAVGLEGMKARVGNDTTETPARLVAASPCEDLAVIKLVNPPSNLKAIKIGDSSKIKAGTEVTVLGFPGTFEASRGEGGGSAGQAEKVVATNGRVSSANVQIAGNIADLPKLPSTIQHQAAVNAGNSGGPLVDDRGELVGINTAGNTGRAGDVQNQFYSISSQRVKSVLPDLQAGRSQANVGWTLIPLPAIESALPAIFAADPDYGSQGGARLGQRVQQVLDQANVQGLYVRKSQPGSPARKALVVYGDLVTALNGQPVRTLGDVCDILQSKSPGEEVRVSGIQINSGRTLSSVLRRFTVTMKLT